MHNATRARAQWTGTWAVVLCGLVSINGAWLAPASSAAVSPAERRRERVERLVADGKAALIARETLTAHRKFTRAHQLDRDYAEANFYLATTRLLSWPIRHKARFAAFGLEGSGGEKLQAADLNPLQFMAVLPASLEIPGQFSRGGKIQQFVRQQAIAVLEDTQENLDRIAPGFVSSLDVRNPLTGAGAIDIDDADVALFRSLVHATLAEAQLTQVYDIDVKVADALQHVETEGRELSVETFQDHPHALHVRDSDEAIRAKENLLGAIEDYLAADRFLSQETDDQSNDLFSFSQLPEDVQRRDAFRRALMDLEKSLTGLSDPAWTLTLSQVLHLGDFFDRPLDARSLETGTGIQEALLAHLLYQSQRALTNLRKAPMSYSEQADPVAYGFTSGRIVEIDSGDLLAIQTGLEALNAAVAVLASYDAEINLPEVAQLVVEQGKQFDIETHLLGTHPNLLRLHDATQLDDAEVATAHVRQSALDTSDYLRTSEDGNQQDDLFRLEGSLAQQEAHWRPQIEALQTFQATLDPDPDRIGDEFRVNMNPLFDGAVDARSLLPQFDGVSPVPGTLPDPTLGGLLPDFTQADWE